MNWPENINNLFGLAVRRERTKRKWSQESLAFRADLNRNYISLIERGERSPTLNTIQQLASAFDIPLSQLISSMEEIVGATDDRHDRT